MLPDLPEEVAHLWQAFIDLDGARTSGMAANPLSFPDIEAYCRLYDFPLTPWEVATVKAVDGAVLQASAKSRSSKEREPDVEVEASDGSAVKGLLRGLGAKKK